MTPIKLKDGLNRPVSPTKAGVTAALLGPTSIVQDADSDICIAYREDAEEVDVMAYSYLHTFSDEQLAQAVEEFLGMVSVTP
jgi:hypothetical protein